MHAPIAVSGDMIRINRELLTEPEPDEHLCKNRVIKGGWKGRVGRQMR